MTIPTELAQSLLEIGLMAAWRGDTVDARSILEGLQSVRPESPLPQIGMAVSFMNEGRHGAAIRALDRALEKDLDCEMVQVHQALACKLAGFEERSRQLCNRVQGACTNGPAAELATVLLGVPSGSTSY